MFVACRSCITVRCQKPDLDLERDDGEEGASLAYSWNKKKKIKVGYNPPSFPNAHLEYQCESSASSPRAHFAYMLNSSLLRETLVPVVDCSSLSRNQRASSSMCLIFSRKRNLFFKYGLTSFTSFSSYKSFRIFGNSWSNGLS